MIFRAIEFATRAHTGHCRKKTKIPYIIHPIGVAKILIESDCPEEVIVASILHDTIEDTPVTVEDIKQEFGDKIAAIVIGASEPDKSAPWEIRKEQTIEYLKTAPMDVVLVTCADKLDNLISLREDLERYGESTWDRFTRGKKQQRWLFKGLAEVLISRIDGEPSNSLIKRFEAEVKKVFPDGDA